MQLIGLPRYLRPFLITQILHLATTVFSVDGLGGRPRGLRPELVAFYDPNASNALFQCLDGSYSIKYLQVNDDYCDCPDGSDEPGTSACSNGKFYCSNQGYKPKLLHSSRVNDGICDCCDGSDEWANPLLNSGEIEAGTSGCLNTCMEMGKEEREERERLAKVIEEGAKLRKEMIEGGHDRKKQREAELGTKKGELEKAKIERDAKLVLKETAEAPEKEALDAIKAEEDRLKQIKEEEDRIAREEAALEVFDQLDANKDGQITKEELLLEIRFDQNNDGMVNDEEAEFYMSGNESYLRETFLDNGWPLMKPVFVEVEQLEDTENSDTGDLDQTGDLDPINEEDVDHPEGDDDEDDDEEEDEDYEEKDEIQTETNPTSDEIREQASEDHSKEDKYDAATQALVDAANAARKEFDAVDRTCRDFERDIQHLEDILGKDYGFEEEFASLYGQCFEYTDQEYTYKLCAFDYCSQRPNSQGGGETRLGNWEKWADELYTAMIYEHGVQCWNGPQRSTKVVLRCGLRNSLVAVTEPNKCEYQFAFETPALCKQLDMSLDNDGSQQVIEDHDEL